MSVAVSMRHLLDRLNVLEADEQEDALIRQLTTPDRTMVLSYLNQHAFNLAYRDPAFRGALRDSSVLLRDGVGVEVGLKLLGSRPGRNANGTDFIPRLLKGSTGKTIAVYGTQSPWLERAVEKIEEAGGRVVAFLDGFRTDADYIASLSEADPDIVLLGMGMPRQEKLASVLMKQPGRPRLIVNGGAILDFYAGRFRRAPLYLRKLRLEWVFRLAQEPHRLAERYLVGGVKFAWRVVNIAVSTSA